MMNLRELLKKLLKGLVRGYQVTISPYIGSSCRFYPSCSEYALIALEKHGILRGSWLAIYRISRCHPWSKGGFDYVPGTEPEDMPHSCSCSAKTSNKDHLNQREENDR